MSMRIAVALAATIGAGIVMSSAAQARPEIVGISGDYTPGTIVVKTHERRLYLILDTGHAMRYPVGVGKAGKQWAGTTKIDGKYLHPACPAAERSQARQAWDTRRHSRRLATQPDGRRGDDVGRRRIRHHGTNVPGSVGGFCILRLHPYAQRRYLRSLSTRAGRNDRDGNPLIRGLD